MLYPLHPSQFWWLRKVDVGREPSQLAVRLTPPRPPAVLRCHGGTIQVSEQRVGDGELLFFKGTKTHASCTIVLRGANDFMLDEMDRWAFRPCPTCSCCICLFGVCMTERLRVWLGIFCGLTFCCCFLPAILCIVAFAAIRNGSLALLSGCACPLHVPMTLLWVFLIHVYTVETASALECCMILGACFRPIHSSSLPPSPSGPCTTL